MVVMSDTIYHLVTGDQLVNFLGKTVSVFGVVTKNGSPGSTAITLNTSDNVAINVSLSSSLTEEINGSYIEVRGNCESKQQIRAKDYFKFNNKTFDATGYTQLCQFLNNTPDIFEYITTNPESLQYQESEDIF